MTTLALSVLPLFASIPNVYRQPHERSAVKPSGATDAFGYDGLGNWTAYTNAEGRVYRMSYDALGRLVAATNAANEQVFANRYDSVGNLTNRTDGAGNTIAYSYDVLNRMVSRSAESAQSADTFTHDSVGNLLTASNDTACLSFAYDAMDRLTTSVSRVTLSPVSSFEFPVSYTRDAGGLVANLVYAPGKTLTRTYDPDGCLASVSDWLGHTWTFAWDGAGKPTGGSAPGGIVATNHYDAAGRLSSWSVGTLAGRTITRDLAGLKTREDVTATPKTPSTPPTTPSANSLLCASAPLRETSPTTRSATASSPATASGSMPTRSSARSAGWPSRRSGPTC